jgi:hypothetical protein
MYPKEDNLLSVLFGSAGNAIGGIPQFQQQQGMNQQKGLLQMLGLQQDQKQMDATEMYRQEMLKAEQARNQMVQQQQEMQVKQALLERLMPPQVTALDQARIAETEAKTAKTKRETELLGKPKPKYGSLEEGATSLAKDRAKIKDNPNVMAGRVETNLLKNPGMAQPQVPQGEMEFNSLQDLEKWYQSPAGRINKNRDKIYQQVKAALGG